MNSMQTATWLHEFKNLPGDVGVQQWMGIQLWERHHQQIQLCTCRSHCQRQERLRLRHTSCFVVVFDKIKMRPKLNERWLTSEANWSKSLNLLTFGSCFDLSKISLVWAKSTFSDTAHVPTMSCKCYTRSLNELLTQYRKTF